MAWGLLLCGGVLAGCASHGGGGDAAGPAQASPTAPASAAAATAAPLAPATAAPASSARVPSPAPAAAPAPAPPPNAVAVDFAGTRHGWAIACGVGPGAECTIVATADGGTAWGAEYRIAAPLAHLQFLNAADGFATGGAAVLATTDGGASWTLRRQSGAALHGVDFLTAQTGWATSAGALARTADGGAHWSPVTVPGTCTLGSVDFSTPSDGWAGGRGPGGPCLLRSTDAGRTWTSVFDSAAASALQPGLAAWEQANGVATPGAVVANMKGDCPVGVHFTSADSGWLTLNCGVYYTGGLVVLHTADGGRSWRYAWGVAGCLMGCNGTTGGYLPLFFLDPDTAWRLGPAGKAAGIPTVQRTLDGGRTWSTGGPDCGTLQCRAVWFLDPVHGWMAAGAGVFATVDGGATWVRQWPAGPAAGAA